MATKNPEDEGRFLKDLLYGVPMEPGLTRSEQNLRELVRISGQLRDLRGSNSVPSSGTPVLPDLSPPRTHIEVHVPDSSRELIPHLRDISEAQRETAEGIETLAHQGKQSLALQEQGIGFERVIAVESRYQSDQGEMALQQRRKMLDHIRHAAMVLEALDEQGRIAYLQRLVLLQSVVSTRSAIQNMDAHLVDGTGQVVTEIQTLQRQGESIFEVLQRQSESSDEIAQLGLQDLQEQRVHTASLRRIESGIGSVAALTVEQNAHLIKIAEGLGGIADAIAAVNVHTARAVDHLGHIEGSIDMFILATRRDLGHIADALKKPAEMHAFNVWEIGERCRRNGDMGAALAKFKGSNEENPSEWRNYHSLGIMCFEIGDTEGAYDFFHKGLRYAQYAGLEGEAKLHLALGKVLYLKQQFDNTRLHLETAYRKDPKNFEVWYYIALLEIKTGDPERALLFLKPLFQLARWGKAPGYMQKIMSEPEFQSIRSRITL